MQQILTNTGNVLDVTFYIDGTATDADGAVTYAVTDGAGDAVQSGTASNTATGVYEFTLAPQADPNVLTVVWSGSFSAVAHSATTQAEVVGQFLFTEAQARAWDAAALANATTYPDDDITDGRVQITEQLEQWTGRSWVERYCRVEVAGTGSRTLVLGDGHARLSDGSRLIRPGRLMDIARVVTATINGTAITAANVLVTGDTLYRTDGYWTAGTATDPLNVVVEYTYGLSSLVNGADRVALMLLRDRLVASAIDDRAYSFSDELGTYRFVTEGGPYGNVSRLPAVNQWVRQNSVRLPVG